MIKILLSQVKQYKWSTIATPIWSAMVVVVGVLIPYATAAIIDKGITLGDTGAVFKYGGLTVIMAAAGLLFGILSAKYGAYCSTGFGANLRTAMYANIQKFSFSDIDKFSTASLITRMTTDVSNIQSAFQMLLRISVRAPLNIIFSLVMCLLINARMSLIFLVAMIILATSVVIIIRKSMDLFSRMMKSYDALNEVTRENVTAMRVVKSFVRENQENIKFGKAVNLLCDLGLKAETMITFNFPIMNLVSYGCMIAISWFGAHMIVSDQLTTGELTALFTYVMTILGSLMMLSMIFIQLTMSAASAKRVAEVISEVPDMYNCDKPLTDVKDGSIEFDNVSFKYTEGGSGEYVLKNIDLSIKSGETIGIIGGTGSGKSSLVSLVSRLYDVTEGSVKVGGVDVRNYDMDALREQVAVVLQKNVLFKGTILENLRWGNANATLQECQEACRQACADEFIEEFPDKYDTIIDQGGTNVSGGQRQRLCIARALLKHPKVLILDDSTSAVDTATDARIRKALGEKAPDMTMIVISQRILSIQNADRIIVLNGGEVSGFDTHEHLLETNEIYRDIYEMQNSGAEADFDK